MKKQLLFLLLLVSTIAFSQTTTTPLGSIKHNNELVTDTISEAIVVRNATTKMLQSISKTKLASQIIASVPNATTTIKGKVKLAGDLGGTADLPTVPSLINKVDKVAGKQLSTNDYTTIEQTKLSGIATGAEVNVNADWNAVSGDALILNKPTIPSGITNISVGNKTATTFAINSSTGSGATIPQATITEAGLINASDKVKLNGIATGATANSTDAQLRDRTTHTGVQAIATVTGLQTALDGKQNTGDFATNTTVTNGLNTKINTSEKGANNGVATLGANGKIPNSQIPALAISETFPVASQAEMLNLTLAEQGDIAIRSDVSRAFILRNTPSSILGNWSELLTPASTVTSVAGKVGAVVLNSGDVGLSNVPNTNFTSAVDLNTAKVGITTAQSNAIVANTAKVGITTAQANSILANTGDNATNTQYSGLATSKENAITPGTTAQYYRGDKTMQPLNVPAVTGLETALNARITGTGTTNQLVKFTGSGAVGNSGVTELANGNVGIGTNTPQVRFHSFGNALNIGDENTYSARFSNNSNKGVVVGYDSANNKGHIGSINPLIAWTDLILNANGGNVGINQPTPTERLDVVGNGKFSGYISANSGIINGSFQAGGVNSSVRIVAASNLNYIQSQNNDFTASVPLLFTGLYGADGDFRFSGPINATGFITTPRISLATRTAMQFTAATAGDLFVGVIPNTRILEIRNGNETSPNYGACGLVTGSGDFRSTVTATSFFQSSDVRLKNIIKRDGDVIYFTWKDKRDTNTHIGYIAQKVRASNPDQVNKDDKGMLSVNYIEILVEKIRNLEKEIEILKAK